MRKCSKYLTIYEEGISHRWLCNRSLLTFLIYDKNFIFFFISVCYFTLEDNSFLCSLLYLYTQQTASNNVQKKFFFSSKLDQLFVSIALLSPRRSTARILEGVFFQIFSSFSEAKLDQLFVSIASFVVPKEVHSKDFRRCFFRFTVVSPKQNIQNIWKLLALIGKVLIWTENYLKKTYSSCDTIFSNVFCNEKKRVIKYTQTWKIALWQRRWTLLYFL